MRRVCNCWPRNVCSAVCTKGQSPSTTNNIGLLATFSNPIIVAKQANSEFKFDGNNRSKALRQRQGGELPAEVICS